MERVEPTETTTITDRELVVRCQIGDENAFDELVTRHQQRAVNVAYQLLRDPEDAMEVAQDAFVRVYRSIGQFRGECAFTTWLHQIVVNLARNQHRWWTRRGKQRTVSMDAPGHTGEGTKPMQVPSTACAPDVELASLEFVRTVSERMGELPRLYREVLVLRNVEEMSYEEIAIALRCSVGTVKSRIARAREALQESLAHERLP